MRRYPAPQRLTAQVSLSLAIRVLGALAGFLTTVIIGQQLGAEQGGYFFWAFGLVMVLATTGRVGFDSTVVRFTGIACAERDFATVRSVLLRAMLAALACSSCIGVILYFSSSNIALRVLGEGAAQPVLACAVPAVVFVALYNLAARSLQGQRRPLAAIAILSICKNLALAGLLFFGDLRVAPQVALAFSMAALITCVLGYLLALRGTVAGSSAVSWRALFHSCLPLWVIAVLAQLTQWSGQLVAGAWVESAELAQFAVAQRCAMLVSLVLVAVNVVVAPRFAAIYHRGDMQQLERLAIRSVQLMLAGATPIVVALLLYPEWFMRLFGEGFAGGAGLLRILVIGQFINIMTGSVGALLNMSGHERDMRNMVLISGPLAIAGALLLAPQYGVTGCAVSTAVAVAAQNLLAVLMVKKRLGFNTLRVWKT